MKKLGWIATCLFMLFAVISCDECDVCEICDDPEEFYLKVITPAANQVFSQDFSINADKVVIEIVFNQAVDPSSVIMGQTALFARDGIPVAATRAFNATNTILTITSTPTVGSFCVFNPDCGFSITLIGTDAGAGTVKDANGNSLDGDANNVEGGDYTTGFGILG